MRKLNRHQANQIAEMTDSKAFILICADNELPCGEDDCDGHEHTFHSFHIDREHAIMVMEMVTNKIINESLRGNSKS